MKRVTRFSEHLSPQQTFTVVEDEEADKVSLLGSSLLSMKRKICFVTGGSRVSVGLDYFEHSLSMCYRELER